MNHSTTTTPSHVPTFESLLQRMTPHFRYYARQVLRLKGDNFDDCMQELITLAYTIYRSLIERGKEVFYTPILKYAIGKYKEGRRFIGSNSVDALSEQTRIRGRSRVKKEDSLFFIADRKTNVAKSVGFKIDFENWYHLQSPKDKSIIHDLAMGETPSDVARKHRQSPASITYRRQYYEKSWRDYTVDRFEGGVA